MILGEFVEAYISLLLVSNWYYYLLINIFLQENLKSNYIVLKFYINIILFYNIIYIYQFSFFLSFMLELAERTNGVVISNDKYRDLYDEKERWRHIIPKR